MVDTIERERGGGIVVIGRVRIGFDEVCKEGYAMLMCRPKGDDHCSTFHYSTHIRPLSILFHPNLSSSSTTCPPSGLHHLPT